MNRTNLKKHHLLGILIAVLLVPIVPFVIFGDQLEPWIENHLAIEDWQSKQGWAATGVITALIADILLPVPSSNVCTFAGRLFGSFNGTLISGIGLTLSCAIGYGLGRFMGWPVVKRLSDEASLADMEQQFDSIGVITLVLFRGVPVLAEASILLAGTYRLAAWKFWPPVVASNFGLAFAYASLGEFASANGWFGLAMAVAFALPATLIVIWFLATSNRQWKRNRKVPARIDDIGEVDDV